MKSAFFKLSICTVLVAFFTIGNSDAVAQDAWGNLKGKIVVEGAFPPNKPEAADDSPDKNICLVDGEIPDDDGIVVSDENELRDVFVLMYTGRGAEVPEKFHPSYDEKKETKLTLDNLKCRFVPKSVFARSGQTLILKNSDNVGHNCHITTFQQEHNINIPANKEVELTLEATDDKLPGDVKCDIHKWMDSVILIRDNPYVAISAADGTFTIENIPAGDWQFQFWHKKGGYLKTIAIKDFEVSKRGVIDSTIKDGETLDLGTLTLPGEALAK